MKKTILTFCFAGTTFITNAQVSWTTDLNHGSTLRLGTSDPAALKLFTNSTERMSLSKDGDLKINSFIGSPGVVVIDNNGNLRPVGTAFNAPCIAGSLPWFNGGNAYPNDNRIGTCSANDFILKANNIESMILTMTGKIGVGPGNNVPLSVLDISNGQGGANNNPMEHTRIYGDLDGKIETTYDMNLVSNDKLNLFFDAGNSGWKNFNIYSGSGTSVGNTPKFTIIGSNGNVGIGSWNPASKLEIQGTGDVKSHIYSISSNSSAKNWVSNTLFAYNFGIDNGGIGRIGGNMNTQNQTNLINFRTDPNNVALPQVWIGDGAVTSTNAKLSVYCAGSNPNAFDVYNSAGTNVEFRVKNTGYVYAREVNVQLAAFPDYVFEKDYKLLPLEQLGSYINKNHHLPNVPSAKTIKENGADLGELSRIQMEKIEELALYIIELEKRLANLENKVER